MTIPNSITFRGRPLLLMEPHSPDSRQQPRTVANTPIEVPSGSRMLETNSETPGAIHQLDFVCETRADVRFLEDFFDSCLGAREGFWIPTWGWEFEIVDHDEADPHHAWIWTKGARYSEVFALGAGYRWLMLLFADKWAIKKALNVTEDHPAGTGWERIEVSNDSEAFAWANTPPFTEAKGYRPLWLRYVRFADDELVVQELGEESEIVTVHMLELPLETP